MSNTRPLCDDCKSERAVVQIRDWSLGIEKTWRRELCSSCLALRQGEADLFFVDELAHVDIVHHYEPRSERVTHQP